MNGDQLERHIEPKINGTASQKIAYLFQYAMFSGWKRHDGSMEIPCGENIETGQDINLILSPTGQWWIEEEK